MQKEFENLVEILKKFDGFVLIDSNLEETWIHFNMTNEINLVSISNQINEIKDQYYCNLLVITNNDDPNQTSYQIIIEGNDKLTTINVLTKKLKAINDVHGNIRRSKYDELGIPDLSLVTIRQMAIELKHRENLTFALVWIDNNEKDNIAIEGSGNPTHLVGLLARATHMAIEWAEKSIKFYKPNNDDK